jgi:hypothetical protein
MNNFEEINLQHLNSPVLRWSLADKRSNLEKSYFSNHSALKKNTSSIYDSTYAWRDNIYSGKQAQTALFKDPDRTAL